MELTFGEKMRLLRTRAGLSVKEVGARSGFHFSTIAKWEREKQSWKDLPFESIERIAKAIGYPVDEFTKNGAAA